MSNVWGVKRKSSECQNCGRSIRLSCKGGKNRWIHLDTKRIHCAPVPPKAVPHPSVFTHSRSLV